MASIEIHHIFVAPQHGFIGQQADAARTHQMQELEEVECVAGSGLRGDRFFDYKEDYKGQATFFSADVFAQACLHVNAPKAPAWAMRRNIMVSGLDLNELVGREFEIAGVRFLGTEECAPCRWMDRAIGPGARAFLAGNGGLRTRILHGGILRRGPQELALVNPPQ